MSMLSAQFAKQLWGSWVWQAAVAIMSFEAVVLALCFFTSLLPNIFGPLPSLLLLTQLPGVWVMSALDALGERIPVAAHLLVFYSGVFLIQVVTLVSLVAIVRLILKRELTWTGPWSS